MECRESEGKTEIVREELSVVATGRPVVRQGNAGWPRDKG
jgi:hypothetical protein